MAHWYHRNPLKATAPCNYDLKGISTTGASQKVCGEIRQARTKLLDIVANPNNDINTIKSTLDTYMSLLHGFITSVDPQASGDSKLRHAIKFRWTNTLLGNTPTDVFDCVFEEASMLFNVAMWFTKHAAKLAGSEQPSMEEAKEVHTCLRTAAGIFIYIKDNLVSKLIEQPEKGTDLDSRVLESYIKQCTAEAQEVTIARSIELKHSASITSSLAYETAKMFEDADHSLSTLDDKLVAKCRKYVQFKVHIYYAYAYNYHGESLLAADKCGEAISCLQESKNRLEKAEASGKEYTSQKGPGTTCKPNEHLFFRKLGPVVDRTLDKCVRENGFIYHQKVPPVVPDLELKATYGLAAPEELTVPSVSPVWTVDSYKAFDLTQTHTPDPKSKKDKEKEEGDLPPVKEADIPQSQKDPSNFSGCVVS